MGRDPGEPSLVEALQMLASQLGAQVEVRGERSIRAIGTVHGRGFVVDIDGDRKGSDLLKSFAQNPRGSRAHIVWRTEIAVGAANPAGLTGVLASFVDVRDPNWNPRIFDPAHCRVVGTDPVELASRILTPSIHHQLMSVLGDVRIGIEPGAVRIVEEQKTDQHGGFVAGSFVHIRPGPIVPWPDRALVGPPWWLLLLAEIAVAVDAVG